ncbi:MAG: isoprenylcysteine carboxylmethyltransferase family protein [Methylovirgula sp.]
MHIFASLLAAIWIVFLVVWIVLAADTKRTARRNMSSWGMRVLILLVIVALLRAPGVRQFFAHLERATWCPALAGVGVALVALGIAFAIWARLHLGRNWGMPMSLKQDPELVMSGPYAYVRHPIYTGVMLAMLGSALVSIWWILPLVLFCIYFVWSAKTEEKIMGSQFADRYREYMTRTKMLIPFVW